ncbi:hypothetical protein ACFWYW_53675 [Nonomuraea sp. NPDC059023]|uniref:hypothetical protein n=1 Tax=unclassified Nonomuraea TaxID=2593643 RepID=UPI0036C553DE
MRARFHQRRTSNGRHSLLLLSLLQARRDWCEVPRFDYAATAAQEAEEAEEPPPLRVEPHRLLVWDLDRARWRVFRGGGPPELIEACGELAARYAAVGAAGRNA